MMWEHPFSRWLCTVPLCDLLIWLLCTGKLPDALDGLILPLLLGGLMLLGIICGAVWGGLPGLRLRTAALYSLLSPAFFPLPYLILFSVREPGLFPLTMLCWNGQQGVGFALGAWRRTVCMKR